MNWFKKITSNKITETDAPDALEIVHKTVPPFTGEIDKTLLFFGHQYRFQESLINKMRNFGAEIEDYKFSNGAMLNLIIEPIGDSYNLYLSLVYSGEDKKNTHGKKYWIDNETQQVNNAKYYFKPKNITVAKNKFNAIFENTVDLNEPVSCYFVRHGKAKHNEVMTVNFETNTELIYPTNDPAIIEGGSILSEKSKSIDYIFVSDLIRTQQTAALFLQAYIGRIAPDKIYVLPCLHELNSRNNGEDKKIERPFYYYENQTTCNHNDTDNFYIKNPKTCKEITIKAVPKTLDWSAYENFFAKYEKHRTPDNPEICNVNHFLGIALDIIYGTSMETGTRRLNGGKTTKKRTTRKAITARKYKKPQKPRKSRKSVN